MNELPILDRTFKVETTIHLYARIAWFYDVWAGLTETKAVQRAFALAQVHDLLAILEVAVGTGRLFADIVAHNPHGRNEGVDLSPAMLAHARERLLKVPPTAYHLQLGSAYELPYPDDSFDIMFNTYMLDLLPEPDFPAVLSEFRRVLKPDGRLVLATFSYGKSGFSHFWYWLAKTFPALLTNCRPVRMGKHVSRAGFHSLQIDVVSQNTFPTEIIVAQKS